MKKFFTFLFASLMAVCMYSENATMTKGSNCDDFTINGNAAVKVGTSSKAGNMTITVGDDAVSLSFYVVGWKGTTGDLTISAPTGTSIIPNSVTPVASNIITGTDKDFTLPDEDVYLVELTITGAKQGAVFTLSRGKRFIVWNASYEVESITTALEDVVQTNNVVKEFKNGQLLIKKGNCAYNSIGVKIQ